MTNALVDKLYQTILGGSQAPAAGDRAYVVLESPTRPVDVARLANLADHVAAGEAALELELFSRLVDDDLPALNPVWESTNVGLRDVFSTLLLATPNGAIQAQKFAEARQVYDMLTLGSIIQPGVKFAPTWPNPLNWAAPEADSLWQTLTIADDGGGTAAANPHVMSPLAMWPDLAYPTPDPLDDDTRGLLDPFPRVRRRADAAAARGELDTIRSVGALDRATGLSLLAAPGRPGLTLAQEIARKPIWDPDNPRGGGLGPADQPLRPGLPPIPPRPIVLPRPPSPPSPPKPPAPAADPATKPMLTLDYLRVSLTRRWFNSLILQFAGWSMPGFAAGYYSTGSRDHNPGVAPLVPTSFIAVRNVEIRGGWSDADQRDVTARLQSPGSTTFGPFTLSNRGSRLGTFDGSTLKIPGISILAWYCSILPASPPVDGG